MGLALDEPSDEDKTFENGGLTFCINAALLETAQNITIDSTPMGFTVESSAALGGSGGDSSGGDSSGGGCSGCGGSCAS